MDYRESRKLVRWVALIVVFIAWLASGLANAESSAAPEQEDVRQVASSLDDWLKGQPHGESWREFLRIEALKDLPEGAEGLRTVNDVQQRLEMVWNTIKGTPLADLRKSLAAWQAVQPPLSFAELRAQAAAAKSELRANTGDDVARARRELEANVRRLNKLFDGDGKRGAQWKSYLHWDDLQRQLASPTISPDELYPIWERFSAHYVGLGLPEFAGTMRSLRATIETADAVNDPELVAELGRSMDAIAEDLGALEGNSPVDLDLLSRRVAQLERLGQANDFVAAVRQRITQPNMVIRASEDLVAAGFDDHVDRTEPVTDTILGTYIQGMGHTVGTIQVRLRPNPNRAEIETLFTGTNWSDNVGRNGPAIIYSNGRTTFAAKNRIAVDKAGLAAGDSRARATAQTTISGTSSTARLLGGIVSNVAYKRAQESRGQAEIIASRHAETRIQDRMDAETGKLIRDANRRYRREFRQPLVERGVFPRSLQFSTTDDHLHIAAIQANSEQLAASTEAAFRLTPSDVAMEIHESLLNNTLQSLFGGRTMREKEVDELAAKYRGKDAAKRFESQGNEEPWTITFAERRPISVAFRNGLIRITLRADELASTERAAEHWHISAAYALEASPDGKSRLVRQGDLEIIPVRLESQPDDRLSTAEAALLTPLRRRFDRVFEPEIKLEPLDFHGRWGKKAGPMGISASRSDDGWLSLAFDRLKRDK